MTTNPTDRGVIVSTHVVSPSATVHASAAPHGEGYDVRLEVAEAHGNRQVSILSVAQAQALAADLAHVLLAAEIRAAEQVTA